ncbi:MAG: hypothetical protein QOH91_1247, partial [Mycobacterium sp.]|nr:hypothetical protein [Mycobacterium sp.]
SRPANHIRLLGTVLACHEAGEDVITKLLLQTATDAASVVDTSAGVCADIRAAVGAAAPSTAAVGTVAPPPSGMGRGSSAVGLGGDLTVPTASHWGTEPG